ncbi:hypothetical protein [Pseudonocardia sp. D17]|uniref:hypothetical protein n=1 Tax=Pseudonocardia sp. D17 TaxID=882661 RepID=UPI0030CE3C78
MRLQADGLPTLHLIRVRDTDGDGVGGARLVLLADSLLDLLAWHERLDEPELSMWAGLASGDSAYVELQGRATVLRDERVPVEVMCMTGLGCGGLTVGKPWIRRPVTVELLRECAGVARGSG